MGFIDILIIDDSVAFNKLTRRSLDKAGVQCNFIEMSNGRKALDYLAASERCPDVILLDMNMPVMDGFDFLKEYSLSHKCLSKTVVYMLSSSARESDMLKAQSYPLLKAYFEKPLSIENVRQIVADLGASKKES